MIRAVFPKIFAVIAVVIAASAVAAFAVPPLIPLLEHAAGRALSYELLLRAYLAVIVFLTLWIGTAWIAVRGPDHGARLLLRWLWIVVAVLFAVFVLDQKWTITEENSWIRYPTAGALFAGGIFLLLSLRAPTQRSERSNLTTHRSIAFLVVALGLLFAAADEIFSIHEALGAALEGAFRLPHVTTDLVTAAYGVVGLGVLIYVFRTVRTLAQSSAAVRQMLALYLAGILLFVFATGFDSVDGIIFSWVRRLTDALTLRGYEFSDAWFIIWKPKLFLNALEEVFELYAAALFAYGAWTIYRGSTSVYRDTGGRTSRILPLLTKEGLGEVDIPPSPPNLPSGRGGSMIALASGGLIIACVALTAATLRMPRETPLADGSPAVKIAGLKDGLFHTDDLDFHPRWGVVVANESEPSRRGTHTGPGVFTYKDGVFARVPDESLTLDDIDSVAVEREGGAIFAASGATGRILRFKDTWEEIYRFQEKEKIAVFGDRQILRCETMGKCPIHPEALASYQDGIVVTDESTGAITVLLTVFPQLRAWQPTHPMYKKPEGIAWHFEKEQYLLTDDTTGTIFVMQLGSLEIFADQSDGLRFPEDIAVGPNGEVIVTDNGAREIIVFDSAGTVLRRVRMRPLFRDLQGVTVDDVGNLYFVTADAFASESFMPSVLWMIPSFFEQKEQQ